ncbi:Selenoprotein [Clostridium sp. IBUN22A]|nr:Selenoprotein [Clostridium sp. IBUN22A]
MTISGETIDYGPCAFMDKYDPETVFSSIDVNGRYAYGNQPKIAAWNLVRFAESLLMILHNDKNESVKLAQNEISKFITLYNENYLSGMRAKLGIFNDEENDEILINQLLNIMKKYHADYTNTFRSLTMVF